MAARAAVEVRKPSRAALTYAKKITKTRHLFKAILLHQPHTSRTPEEQRDAWDRVHRDVWHDEHVLFDVEAEFGKLIEIIDPTHAVFSGWDAEMLQQHDQLVQEYVHFLEATEDLANFDAAPVGVAGQVASGPQSELHEQHVEEHSAKALHSSVAAIVDEDPSDAARQPCPSHESREDETETEEEPVGQREDQEESMRAATPAVVDSTQEPPHEHTSTLVDLVVQEMAPRREETPASTDRIQQETTPPREQTPASIDPVLLVEAVAQIRPHDASKGLPKKRLWCRVQCAMSDRGHPYQLPSKTLKYELNRLLKMLTDPVYASKHAELCTQVAQYCRSLPQPTGPMQRFLASLTPPAMKPSRGWMLRSSPPARSPQCVNNAEDISDPRQNGESRMKRQRLAQSTSSTSAHPTDKALTLQDLQAERHRHIHEEFMALINYRKRYESLLRLDGGR